LRLASRWEERKETLSKDNRRNLSIKMSQYLWKKYVQLWVDFLIVGFLLFKLSYGFSATNCPAQLI